MRDRGIKGENLAINYLKKKGYKILERNYRTRAGEIDIIASKDGMVVFVEVKTRSTDLFGAPEESVTKEKQERLKKAALYYLKDLKNMPPLRFDVISIELKPEPTIVHIEYAF
ncbi:MAG: YraN family protein [Thermodesulfovibrionales bacterium]|nr:YraN family protein [Thermodesulfovibrionales bacterium]